MFEPYSCYEVFQIPVFWQEEVFYTVTNWANWREAFRTVAQKILNTSCMLQPATARSEGGYTRMCSQTACRAICHKLMNVCDDASLNSICSGQKSPLPSSISVGFSRNRENQRNHFCAQRKSRVNFFRTKNFVDCW